MEVEDERRPFRIIDNLAPGAEMRCYPALLQA
jgi:hypothetical protein